MRAFESEPLGEGVQFLLAVGEEVAPGGVVLADLRRDMGAVDVDSHRPVPRYACCSAVRAADDLRRPVCLADPAAAGIFPSVAVSIAAGLQPWYIRARNQRVVPCL